LGDPELQLTAVSAALEILGSHLILITPYILPLQIAAYDNGCSAKQKISVTSQHAPRARPRFRFVTGD
jgi:hypothetical protein